MYKNNRTGKTLLVLGFTAIIMIFVIYARYQNSELFTPEAFDSFQRIALGFYLILIAAFGIIAYGLFLYQKFKFENKSDDLIFFIAQATSNNKSKKVFIITFACYGVFFSLVSGTLVYQPEVNFAIHYGAEIPSGFISPCCDEIGYMPKIIFYLTEHVGFQIIPINLLLQIIVSFLVGINASIASYAYSISKKGGQISAIGAITGLFIACPTCAGTFFSIFIGTASGIALSIAITQLQTFFIAISIPVLVIIPFVMARKLRKFSDSCNLDSTK